MPRIDANRKRLARIERERGKSAIPQAGVVLYSPTADEVVAAVAANPHAPIVALTFTPPRRSATDPT